MFDLTQILDLAAVSVFAGMIISFLTQLIKTFPPIGEWLDEDERRKKGLVLVLTIPTTFAYYFGGISLVGQDWLAIVGTIALNLVISLTSSFIVYQVVIKAFLTPKP